MRLRANVPEKYLLVRPLSIAVPLFLNGFRLKDDQAYEAQEGDILSLLFDSSDAYGFRIQIQESSSKDTPKKRCYEKMDKVSNGSPEESIQPAKTIKSEAAEDTTWERLADGQLYMMTWKGVEPREKIAAYDIDGTIIKTKSGRVFAKDIDDWQLAFAEIPGKLKELQRNGFKIVFLTNQSGMTVGKLKPEDFKKKLKSIIGKLNIPIQVLVAPGVNKFRKPMTGMWEYLEKEANGGVPIDKIRSFYVGDAAGRPVRGSIKKDHSCCDRLLALNLKVPFFTPEEHFLKAKTATNWIKPEFQPSELDEDKPLLIPSSATLKSPNQEMVLIVGYPGSGKSYFSKQNYGSDSQYVVVNRDTLGSWQKCVAEAERALSQKKSVVVDNTNPDLESRKRYIDLAQKFKVPIRCFAMTTTFKHSKHNVRFREILDPKHMKITDMILNSYK